MLYMLIAFNTYIFNCKEMPDILFTVQHVVDVDQLLTKYVCSDAATLQ